MGRDVTQADGRSSTSLRGLNITFFDVTGEPVLSEPIVFTGQAMPGAGSRFDRAVGRGGISPLRSGIRGAGESVAGLGTTDTLGTAKISRWGDNLFCQG